MTQIIFAQRLERMRGRQAKEKRIELQNTAGGRARQIFNSNFIGDITNHAIFSHVPGGEGVICVILPAMGLNLRIRGQRQKCLLQSRAFGEVSQILRRSLRQHPAKMNDADTGGDALGEFQLMR